MNFRNAFLGIILIAAATLFSPAGQAAEIVPIQLEVYDGLNNLSIDVDSGLGFNLEPDGDVRCNFLLNGDIQQGDLDRLKAAIPPFETRDVNKIPRLCLNSRGGSYPEGLAISKYLMAENIGTAVPDSAICFSSCSLIFMGGTYPWKGELNRFLHAGGIVGFHAPYVMGLDDQAYNNEAMAAAYSEGVAAIRELMSLGVGNKVQRFPPELMAELLARGKDDLFNIDTVGKAIRFRVHLYGTRANPEIDKQSFCNACMNMNYGAQESYGKGGENDLCATDAEVEEKPFPKGKRMISGAAPRGGTCAIDIETDGAKTSKWMFVDDDAQWNDGLELAYWYLYSPSTWIKDLADGKQDTSLTKADGTPAFVAAPKEPERDLATELANFVKDAYLGHGKENHVSDDTIFADEVEYYDEGRIPRSEVTADHDNYYRKWPERLYEMIADSLKFTPTSDNTVDATFRYAYQLANGTKKTGGIGVTNLSIQLRDGRFEITKEQGKVVSRN